jgi:hypothetical protein
MKFYKRFEVQPTREADNDNGIVVMPDDPNQTINYYSVYGYTQEGFADWFADCVSNQCAQLVCGILGIHGDDIKPLKKEGT